MDFRLNLTWYGAYLRFIFCAFLTLGSFRVACASARGIKSDVFIPGFLGTSSGLTPGVKALEASVQKPKLKLDSVQKVSEDFRNERLEAYQRMRQESEDYLPPGYLEKPFEDGKYLEGLRMCESALALPKGHTWLNCRQDSTCKECIPARQLELGMEMRDVCLGKGDLFRRRREQLFKNTLAPPAEQHAPLIVIAVTSNFLSLIVNWACGRLFLGLGDPFLDTVLLTTQAETHLALTSAGFRTVLHPEEHFDNAPTKADIPHKACQSMLFCVLHQLSDMGYDVILHDVDLVWLRDPRDGLLFNPQWNKVDVIGANAPRWDSHGPMNSGFIFFRSNRKTRAYLRAMVELTPIMYWLGTDQVMYNSLLRHWRFGQLHYHILPRSSFVDLHTFDGKSGTVKMISNETYVLHAVSSDGSADKVGHKASRLNLVGQWYVKKECTPFEKKINTSFCKTFIDVCISPIIDAPPLRPY